MRTPEALSDRGPENHSSLLCDLQLSDNFIWKSPLPLCDYIICASLSGALKHVCREHLNMVDLGTAATCHHTLQCMIARLLQTCQDSDTTCWHAWREHAQAHFRIGLDLVCMLARRDSVIT